MFLHKSLLKQTFLKNNPAFYICFDGFGLSPPSDNILFVMLCAIVGLLMHQGAVEEATAILVQIVFDFRPGELTALQRCMVLPLKQSSWRCSGAFGAAAVRLALQRCVWRCTGAFGAAPVRLALPGLTYDELISYL